jgi:hypothetical protein
MINQSSMKKKRNIPVFKLNLPEGYSIEDVGDHPGIRKVVISEVIFAIKEGIKKKKKSIPLFQVAGTNTYIELERDNWKNTLTHFINQFTENEEYEQCIELRDLINQI